MKTLNMGVSTFMNLGGFHYPTNNNTECSNFMTNSLFRKFKSTFDSESAWERAV